MRKGIILAGGSGTRLYPVTQAVCKQLLPVYDKPMIYYPLSTLMLAGIREIEIITTPQDKGVFRCLLGDGSRIGVNLTYSIQEKPNGLAEAFLIADRDGFLIEGDKSCLILGDNIFFGHGLPEMMQKASSKKNGATVFGYHVNDPERYGVVEFKGSVVYGKLNKAVSIEEKPQKPKSNYAVVGLYFYDSDVINITKGLKPSKRGELEITDVNKAYLKEGKLEVQLMGRGFAWLDTGTHDSMADATDFVKVTEKRQGLKIGCIEEIAYAMNYIDARQMERIAEPLRKSGYGEYLLRLLDRK